MQSGRRLCPARGCVRVLAASPLRDPPPYALLTRLSVLSRSVLDAEERARMAEEQARGAENRAASQRARALAVSARPCAPAYLTARPCDAFWWVFRVVACTLDLATTDESLASSVVSHHQWSLIISGCQIQSQQLLTKTSQLFFSVRCFSGQAHYRKPRVVGCIKQSVVCRDAGP